MVNPCQKGKRVERELAIWLRARGAVSARRTHQYNGADGLSDNVADELPEWHLESKGTTSGVLKRSDFVKWIEQAKRDCGKDGYGKAPVVMCKANRNNWTSILPYNSFIKIFGEYFQKWKVHAIPDDGFNPQSWFTRLVKEQAGLVSVGLEPRIKMPVLVTSGINGSWEKPDLILFIDGEDWARYALGEKYKRPEVTAESSGLEATTN